jgi:hypothetical protein
MIEIKIDRATLPKDGQKIRWQTQSDIINGTWKEGVFGEEEDAFNVGFEDVVQHWDLAWDVHHWEVLSYDISDVIDSSSEWNRLAEALKDEFGENLVEEESGEEDPYNWWLTDVTVTDIIDFLKNYR